MSALAGMTGRSASTSESQLWVIKRRTQRERIVSALPPVTRLFFACARNFAVGPFADILIAVSPSHALMAPSSWPAGRRRSQLHQP
jgi:hypothetical protein